MNKSDFIQEQIKNIYRDHCDDKETYHKELMLALINDIRCSSCNPHKRICTIMSNFLYLFEEEEAKR